MNHETVQKIIAREKFATFSARAEGRWGGGVLLTGLQVMRASQIVSAPFRGGKKKLKNIEAVKSASMTHSHMTHEHHTHNCVGDKTTVNISLFVLSFGCDMKVD